MSNVASLKLVSDRSNPSVAPAARVEVPADVKRSLDNWALSGRWSPPPADYARFHLDLANAELQRIAQLYHLDIVTEELVVDPWLDGLEVLRADVVTRSSQRRRLSWNDALQAFTVEMRGGRQGVVFESDLA